MEFSLVVISRLQKLDAVIEYLVHEAISFVDSTRPDVCTEILERFRFPDSTCRFAQNGVHQIEHSQCSLSIGVNPVAQIVEAFALNHSDAPLLDARSQGASPNSRRRVTKAIESLFPRRARVIAANRRAAFSGERSRYAVSRRLESSSAGMSAMSSWPRR